MNSPERRADPPLHQRLAQLFYTKLARASALMVGGSLIGGLLGYLQQVLMGRMLSTPEFGLFSAMMALFAVASAPVATLLHVIARRVAEYNAAGDMGSIRHFYSSITARTAGVAALLLIAIALCTPWLQQYLKSAEAMPVYLLALLFFFSFFPVINDAFLQGLQAFSWLSASGVVRILSRIVFSVLLVWAGYAVSGAIAGIVVAMVFAWTFTYYPLHRPLAAGHGHFHRDAHLALKSALPVLVANTAFATMTQLDMVLVNHYFEPHDVGIYAAASVLGKAIMWLSGGIANALFPMVAENQARQRSSAHLLLQAVGLTSLFCVLGAAFYLVAGEWLVVALFGTEYRAAGSLLKSFGFAMLPMSLVLVAEYFLIAKGRVIFAYLLLLSAPVQVALIHHFHDSLTMVVAIVGVTGAIVASVGYAMLWRSFVHE